MKPQHIILVRHGQSEGNVNKDIYAQKPDYALDLTDEGKRQAYQAGIEIRDFLEQESEDAIPHGSAFYVSPFWRTRRTFEQLATVLNVEKYYEDPRIREQEWGSRIEPFNRKLEEVRDNYGHFYFRFPDGESCSDVFDRVSLFLDTLWRDFESVNYPKNTIIVTHGMTLRLFLMRWFHLSVEQFELLANPKNCEYFVLKLMENGKYKLTRMPKTYESRNHDFQFKWSNRDWSEALSNMVM